MKKYFILSFLSLIFQLGAIITVAQTPDWLWAKSAGGSTSDEPYAVATDASGNVYIAGYFWSSSITFGSFTLTNSGTAYDLFLVKYDNAGNVLWAKSVGQGNGLDVAFSVTTDAAGSIYLAGYFTSSYLVFGADTITNSNAGASDLFLVKYNNTGNVLWAKSAGGNFDDEAYSVTAEAGGNILIAGGFYSSSLIFGSDTLTNSSAGTDMFLVKYDNAGSVLWAKSSGGSNNDEAYSVTADAGGNIVVAGYFISPTITFGSFTLTNVGANYRDMFLVKYDNAGSVVWAKRAGGSSGEFANSLTSDAGGNIYVAGHFGSDTLIFGTDTLTNAGNYDMFLAKYDNSGNVVWAKSAGGSPVDEAHSVTTDVGGNIYVTGYFNSSMIIFGSDTLLNSVLSDMFLVKYDNAGNVIWAKSEGGNGLDEALAITTDASGNIYMTGRFSSNSLLFSSFTLMNVGDYDIFLAKLSSSIIGIESIDNKKGIIVYPNPASGTFNLSLSYFQDSPVQIDMFNILGKRIYAEKINVNQNEQFIEINLGKLSAGIYIVQVKAGTEQFSKKLVIE